MKTKQHYRQTDGVQYYHIIQSFKPGEVTPELALEIAKAFCCRASAATRRSSASMWTRSDIPRPHTIFQSVNADTGEKYHSNARSYYSQIRPPRTACAGNTASLLSWRAKQKGSQLHRVAAAEQGPAHLPLHAGADLRSQ